LGSGWLQMIKSGINKASISGIRPEMVLAFIIIQRVLNTKYNVEAVIVSCVDSKHGRGSLHFLGLALDIRTRDMDPNMLGPATLDIKEALGDDYDVVLESNHWHVEFQPKTGINL